jgi:hypothetical protein
LAGSVWGQELDLSFLKDIEDKAKEATNITLGKEQMQLISGLSGSSGVDLKTLAAGLEMVQVKVLEFDKEGMFRMADMETLRNKVKGADMVPVISVREKNGFTEILMRKGPKGNRGFVILAAEPRELTIVNIVGELDLSSLGKLSGKFGIPNVSMGPVEGRAGSKPAAPKEAKKEEEEDNLL